MEGSRAIPKPAANPNTHQTPVETLSKIEDELDWKSSSDLISAIKMLKRICGDHSEKYGDTPTFCIVMPLQSMGGHLHLYDVGFCLHVSGSGVAGTLLHTILIKRSPTDSKLFVGFFLDGNWSVLPPPPSNPSDFWIGSFGKFTGKGPVCLLKSIAKSPVWIFRLRNSNGFWGCRSFLSLPT